MLETIIVIILVMWLLGMVTSYTLSGWLHVLIPIAIVVFVIRMLRRKGDDL